MRSTTTIAVSDADRQLIREAVLLDASGLDDLAVAIDNNDSEQARRHGKRAIEVVAMLTAVGYVQADAPGPVAPEAVDYATTTADEIDAMLAEGEGQPVRDAERADALRRFVEAVS